MAWLIAGVTDAFHAAPAAPLPACSDRHLELIAKLMRCYNAVMAAYQQLRAWIVSNGALAVALLVLLLALLLKWLGFM